MNGLSGILWKPGINGLGVLGFHKLPYRKRFDGAARQHDSDYDSKGDAWWRRFYDIKFLWNMIGACDTDFQVGFAVFYFVMARLFGWAFYRYRRN